MSDLINLSDNVTDVSVSPEFDTYSKVIIHIDNNTQVVAGNDSGLTLEIDNPFGSQDMANRILDSLSGFRYSPYTADGAELDPAAEIGDAAQTATSFGGIYTRSRRFGRLMKADISAPCDEEIDHEFKFEQPSERKFKRTVGEVKASILLNSTMIQTEVSERKSADESLGSIITQTSDRITAEVARATQAEGNLSASLSLQENAINAEVTRATTAEGNLSATLSLQAEAISAKVASSGGGSSFSWTLTSDSHSWKSNGTEVMRISASGLWVKGEIQASKGTIGGFTIGSSAIYKNISEFDGTQTNGVYLGTDGIQLGQHFKVSSSGEVSASRISAHNMTLTGTLNIGGTDITAAALRSGAATAYANGGTWSATSSAWGWATSSNTSICPNTFTAKAIFAKNVLYANNALVVDGKANLNGGMSVSGFDVSWKTKTIDGTTITYLGR